MEKERNVSAVPAEEELQNGQTVGEIEQLDTETQNLSRSLDPDAVRNEENAEIGKKRDYKSEIISIVRGTLSPGIMRDRLENYHENDLAEVLPSLTAAERKKLYRILNTDVLSDIMEETLLKQKSY